MREKLILRKRQFLISLFFGVISKNMCFLGLPRDRVVTYHDGTIHTYGELMDEFTQTVVVRNGYVDFRHMCSHLVAHLPTLQPTDTSIALTSLRDWTCRVTRNVSSPLNLVSDWAEATDNAIADRESTTTEITPAMRLVVAGMEGRLRFNGRKPTCMDMMSRLLLEAIHDNKIMKLYVATRSVNNLAVGLRSVEPYDGSTDIKSHVLRVQASSDISIHAVMNVICALDVVEDLLKTAPTNVQEITMRCVAESVVRAWSVAPDTVMKQSRLASEVVLRHLTDAQPCAQPTAYARLFFLE